MTTLIRVAENFSLIQDNFTKLYTVDNQEDVSLWMDVYEARPLLDAETDKDFIRECQLCF